MTTRVLRLPKTPSIQVREVKTDRRIPGVVVVVDHLGTAAREALCAKLK
jgi:hypothetical protein